MSQNANEQGTPPHRGGPAAAADWVRGRRGGGGGTSNADGGPQTPARRPEREGESRGKAEVQQLATELQPVQVRYATTDAWVSREISLILAPLWFPRGGGLIDKQWLAPPRIRRLRAFPELDAAPAAKRLHNSTEEARAGEGRGGGRLSN